MSSVARLTVKRGDTWRQVFRWVGSDGLAVDLTDCTARLKWRDAQGDVAVTASTEDDTLTLDGPAGTITTDVDAADMSLLEPGRYRCDVELTYPDGLVRSTKTILITVEEDITYG